MLMIINNKQIFVYCLINPIPMKNLFLLFISITAFSQKVVHITPQQLADKIKKNSKATVVQFWIPNCANVDEIVAEYKRLEEEHGGAVNFYFVGITNKDELVTAVIQRTGYKNNLYVADPSVAEIYARKKAFAKALCAGLDTKPTDFITLYLGCNDKVVYKGNAIDVSEKKLKKIIRKCIEPNL